MNDEAAHFSDTARFSWLTRAAIALAVLHFPLLLLRLSFLFHVQSLWPEVLIFGGPALALAGTLQGVLRRYRSDTLMCILLLAGYLLTYSTWWLAAGRPEFTFGPTPPANITSP